MSPRLSRRGSGRHSAQSRTAAVVTRRPTTVATGSSANSDFASADPSCSDTMLATISAGGGTESEAVLAYAASAGSRKRNHPAGPPGSRWYAGSVLTRSTLLFRECRRPRRGVRDLHEPADPAAVAVEGQHVRERRGHLPAGAPRGGTVGAEHDAPAVSRGQVLLGLRSHRVVPGHPAPAAPDHVVGAGVLAAQPVRQPGREATGEGLGEQRVQGGRVGVGERRVQPGGGGETIVHGRQPTTYAGRRARLTLFRGHPTVA